MSVPGRRLAAFPKAVGPIAAPAHVAIRAWGGSETGSPPALRKTLATDSVVLGMFTDGRSMLVITVPIAVPVILQFGVDPVWFDVIAVIVIETGKIAPPGARTSCSSAGPRARRCR